MRTTPPEPPFPVDLGTWLANFRYRLRDARGNPYSPEQLGREIGVSGATVRRWESGRLRPSTQDAFNFAAVCRLTPLQQAFLNRALRPSIPVPPDTQRFRECIGDLLSGGFPAYVLDGLMFVRAWNSYLPALLGRPREPRNDLHAIEYMFESVEHSREIEPTLPDRVSRIIQEFWYLTAEFCCTEAYRHLIKRLAAHELFREIWLGLAFLDETECNVIGAPMSPWRADIGRCHISSSAVVMPPVYYFREFVPIDETAIKQVAAIRESGPASIHFDEVLHWSLASKHESLISA